MTDKKDWANISDDEDESYEDSPEPLSANQPNEQEPEPEEQQSPKEEQGQAGEITENKGRRDNQRHKRSEEEQKAELIKEIEALPGPKFYLNLHGLDSSVKAENIREFYQPITISSIIVSQTKAGLLDLEFTTKEDAIKAVQKGSGNLGKYPFCLRTSHRNYPKDQMRQKDRGNKPYGQRGQGQGGRGGYDNKNRGDRGGYNRGNDYRERDDYYYKNQEGRNYDKKTRSDQGNWKGQGQGQGQGDRPQYQVRSNEERKGEEQQFANARQPERRQESDKWEKGQQLPDEPRRQDYQRKDEYQRRDDRGGYNKDKFQMKKYNSDYTEGNYGGGYNKGGYRGNEDKSETIEKGRGTKKYNQDEPLEQDKILQLKEKQSSYKSQGSDKGYYRKDYNKGGYDNKNYGGGGYGGDNYNKSRYHDDQKNYQARDERVYTKKNDYQEGATPTNKDTQLEKKKSFNQATKNTANPFNILEDNGKK